MVVFDDYGGSGDIVGRGGSGSSSDSAGGGGDRFR